MLSTIHFHKKSVLRTQALYTTTLALTVSRVFFSNMCSKASKSWISPINTSVYIFIESPVVTYSWTRSPLIVSSRWWWYEAMWLLVLGHFLLLIMSPKYINALAKRSIGDWRCNRLVLLLRHRLQPACTFQHTSYDCFRSWTVCYQLVCSDIYPLSLCQKHVWEAASEEAKEFWDKYSDLLDTIASFKTLGHIAIVLYNIPFMLLLKHSIRLCNVGGHPICVRILNKPSIFPDQMLLCDQWRKHLFALGLFPAGGGLKTSCLLLIYLNEIHNFIPVIRDLQVVVVKRV